jgi:hypothetical protein
MLGRVISKIKQNGFFWFVWRLKREVRNPSFPFIRKLIDKYLHAQKKFSKLWCDTREDDFLYVIYDLDISAITFNVVECLINSEYEAKIRNKIGFVVVFVPPSNDPNLVWKEYDSVIDVINRQWRFHNIVVPLTSLSEQCKGIYILPQRSDVIEFVKGRNIYPDLYDGINIRAGQYSGEFYNKFDRPNLFKGLRAPKQGLKYIQKWIAENQIKQPIVTISIRNYAFDEVRNSNIEAWSKFANYLVSNGYFPVIIPDTDTAFDKNHGFDGVCVFQECAWNMGLRMSLHESAFLNFFGDHGCSALAVYNPQCKYIRMGEMLLSMVATEEAWNKHNREANMSFGDNYKFASPGQWLCYKPDSFENIVCEFERFVREQKLQ